MRKPKIQVILKNYQRKWQIDSAAVRHFANQAWIAIGRNGIKLPEVTEMSLVFLNLKQMQRYNNDYRKKDYPTDVLSFPFNEFTEENKHYLGDVLICLEKAAENAKEAGHSFHQELQILLLHGILHLMGYDHESDRGEMNAFEAKLRRSLIDNRRLTRARSNASLS